MVYRVSPKTTTLRFTKSGHGSVHDHLNYVFMYICCVPFCSTNRGNHPPRIKIVFLGGNIECNIIIIYYIKVFRVCISIL